MPEKLSARLKHLATLYVTEELTPGQAERFEERIEQSSLLRQYVEELKSALDLSQQLRSKEPPEIFLKHQRNLLKAKIDMLPGKSVEGTIGRTGRIILDRMDRLFSPRVRPALVAASYVILGLILGRYLLVSPDAPWGPPEQSQAWVEDRIQKILASGQLAATHIEPIRNGSDRVTFRLKSEDEFVYTGDIKERVVRELLYYLLLNESNPGKRLQSIKLISEYTADDEMKMVLVAALLSDKNPGVRLRAIKNLSLYPVDKTIRDTCIKTLLEDDNTALRMEALKILVRNPHESLLPVLQAVSRLDENEFIRAEAGRLLDRLMPSPGTQRMEENP
ncbi:MAG: HEAT repeat domain-containing protein [Fidelibacterota bacterium]